MVSNLNFIYMVIRYVAILIGAVLMIFSFFNKANAFFHPVEIELDHYEVVRHLEKALEEGGRDVGQREWEILSSDRYKNDNEKEKPYISSD